MKNKYIHMMKKIAAFFLLFVLCLTDITYVYADNEEQITGEETIDPENLIEISTAEELLELAENCKLDAYSIGKRVELKNNINLKDIDFSGIPYFNGIFDGNGYEIMNLAIKEKGSRYGLFRYIGELGIVSDVKVLGAIAPTGSQEEIGGIAGVNYGTIQNSSFIGTVYGVDTVGCIAGLNGSTGQIIDCEAMAVVLATDNTGGIAGINEGIISNCISKCAINNEELETEMDLGGIDIGTMNFTQTVVTRNNMGGIAGKSTGIVEDCQNYGEIGYAHTGYNVGGIVGWQNGVVIDCSNDGTVYGRKDVGGIVGQAEPYVESEYLSEQIEQTKRDIDRINNTLDSLTSSIESTSEEANGYTDAFTEQFEGTSGTLSERIDQLKEVLPEGNGEAQGYMKHMNEAMDKIEKIQSKEGSLTTDDIADIQKQMEIIQENTEKLGKIAEEEEKAQENEEDIETVADSIDTLTSQTETMVDHLYDSTAVIRGEKDYIVDVSSVNTASKMDGVISGCVNRGMVDGDINVGGIAGTMNLEYSDDPEANLDISEEADIAISSDVNDVLINCINYAKVNGKKNYVGSIVGYQEFGYLYQCEGYGHVIASAGNYVGGIAGMSGGTIEKSYAMLDLSGQDYVGGIAGEGTTIIDCLSVVSIETEGERIGGVAGFLTEDGSVRGNYFVKDEFDAIDNISYFGIAEPLSYEEIMLIEGIPEGFMQIQIAFEIEDEVISERMIAYGSSLTMEDFPVLEEREDAYIKWPEAEIYTNIKNNLTITAEYQPWVQSIASAETSEDGKPLFIAVEKFYEGTELQMTEALSVMPLEDNQSLLYAYDWSISSEKEKMIESVEGHFYIPEVEGEIELWVENDGNWTYTEYTVDGRYLVAEVPYGAMFTMIEIPVDNTSLYLTIAIAVVAVLLVISLVIVHNERKRKAQ